MFLITEPERRNSASYWAITSLALIVLLPPGDSGKPSRHATLFTGGFSDFVTSTAADCYRAERNQLPGGSSPAVDQRLSTAHWTLWATLLLDCQYGRFPSIELRKAGVSATSADALL